MQSNMSCIMWADKRQENEESIRKGWMQFLLFRCKIKTSKMSFFILVLV